MLKCWANEMSKIAFHWFFLMCSICSAKQYIHGKQKKDNCIKTLGFPLFCQHNTITKKGEKKEQYFQLKRRIHTLKITETHKL